MIGFIDHASEYVSIKQQVAINATETIKAKPNFGRETQSQVVVIKGYHTDNGIFNASDFMEGMLEKQRKIRFSGSSASHKNGVAERAIKTVVNTASAILVQAWMICHKDTLSIDFGQRKWTILYGY